MGAAACELRHRARYFRDAAAESGGSTCLLEMALSLDRVAAWIEATAVRVLSAERVRPGC